MNEIVKQDIQEIIAGIGPEVMQLEGKEILITGACGFLGSWFVAVFHHLNHHVFKNPCTVFAMDSGIASDGNNSLMEIVDNHILWRQDDISTAPLQGSVDYIIHAAGIASPIYYRKFPIETIDGMALGLSNLLKFASKYPVHSFLYFSSSEMYGNPTDDMVPTPETYNGNVSCLGPRSCYDETKRMGETMCVAYHKVHKVPVKWVRPFNIYGPGMRVKDDRVVPKFVFQMLRNENITVHIPGLQTRTFCYVTDAMVGFFKTLLSNANGEVFNIGTDKEEISMVDLAKKMRGMFSTKSGIDEIEMPPEYPRDQAQRRCPNIDKARLILKYDPSVDLDSGLIRMWEWGETKI